MVCRLTVLWLLLLCNRSLQASTLKGVVLANQEGGAPVAKVKVSTEGANLTETGEGGGFTLQFPNKQPGETVQLVISKPGYVVVNWFQLRVTLSKNADAEPLTLLVCKEAEREQGRQRESCEAAVVTNFCVAAEKTAESKEVQI